MASSLKRLISGCMAGLLIIIPAITVAAEYDAVLEWKQRVELSTFVTGVVAEVNVKPGDKVNKGDILLALDESTLKANLEKAEANVTRWQRKHDEAERELERHNELFDRTVLSEHELEVANIAMTEATANLKAALAERAQATSFYNNSKLRAPFDGVVIQLNASVGQTVVNNQTSTVLAVVAATGAMIASTLLPYDTIKRLKLGQTTSVTVSMGFEPVSSSDRRYNVLVEFLIKTKLMRAGQKAKVKIP